MITNPDLNSEGRFARTTVRQQVPRADKLLSSDSHDGMRLSSIERAAAVNLRVNLRERTPSRDDPCVPGLIRRRPIQFTSQRF